MLPHSTRVFEALAGDGVPMTHFGVGTAELLGAMSEAVAAAASPVVGVDWRTSLTDAAARVAPGTALQGNLDPVVLLAGMPVAERAARAVVEDGRRAVDAGAAGHVFNLGHGVLPGDGSGCHHRGGGFGALAVMPRRRSGTVVLRCRRRYFGPRRRIPAAGHARRRRGYPRALRSCAGKPCVTGWGAIRRPATALELLGLVHCSFYN